MKQDNRTQWRSLEARDPSNDQRDAWRNEFPEGATELEVNSVTRRQFLGIMGASTALAGVGLQGCIRKPEQEILPYTERPEDVIPGEARYFATNLVVAGSLQPALVESHDGRPTKIEGNPRDARTQGATSAFAQGEILRLYDPSRVQSPTRSTGEARNQTLTMGALGDDLDTVREALAASGGANAAIVTSDVPSPTFRAQLKRFADAYPNARLFHFDAAETGNRREAMRQMGNAGAAVDLNLEDAKVILALDSDFLISDGDAVTNTLAFANGRRITRNQAEMSRFYAVEPGYTATGMNADEHLSLPASQVGALARALAAKLSVAGAGNAEAPGDTSAWIDALAADLTAHRGESAVIVGERQPAWVHVLGAAINDALGNTGKTVRYFAASDVPALESTAALAAALADGSIQTLITLGVNPAAGAADSASIRENLAKVETLIALSYYEDETTAAAGWVIPEAHPLEAWGDVRSPDGRGGIQQPLIAPLFEAVSAIELLEHLVAQTQKDAYELVRNNWRGRATGAIFGSFWNRVLHDGVTTSASGETASLQIGSALSAALAGAETPAVPSSNAIEISFELDPTIYDGRYANLSWLQELPHPVTKLTWDNAALMNTKTADALGIDWTKCQAKGVYTARVIELTTDAGTVSVPAFVLPGVADFVVQLTAGYGRSIGPVAEGAGVDITPLRSVSSPGFATGVQAATNGDSYVLASTQDHWSLVPMDNESYARPNIAREATLSEFRANQHFVDDKDIMELSKLKSLWTEPNPRDGQQWGMTIDLNSCTGCGACTIACQAENNIPNVGKEQVLNGREMHWIRIDRYFVGPEEDAQVINQPLNCMQCETAPCEQVCPVAATVHSPSGLNDMVYNRCIGTRYCANNCPYKVRRFNFFNSSKYEYQDNPLIEMQRNPDVTPRFRGVMEKCTYCVQRINEARINAKVDGSGIVPDGVIQTACEQVCPAKAIQFGDVSDATSAVSELKDSPRNYSLLSYLNTKPRTTYLAKLRNPNPELV